MRLKAGGTIFLRRCGRMPPPKNHALLLFMQISLVPAVIFFSTVSIGGCSGSRVSPERHQEEHVVIPTNLEECFSELRRIFPPKELEEFRTMSEEDMVIKYHFSTGLWIRNNWGLWTGSRLARYFNSMGIKRAEEMSIVILTSFHRYLNQREIDLEGQIREIGRYQKDLEQELSK